MSNIKSRFVATASIWLINLLMIGLIILLVFQSTAIITMYKPVESIGNLAGVETYSTDVSLEAFNYKLKRELNYSSPESDKPYLSTLMFTPPFEFISSEYYFNSEITIRPKADSELVARIDDEHAAPVEYVFTDSNKQFWITTLYVIAYVLSILIVFWWLWALRKLVKNIAGQKFFITENVRQFIYLAIPLLLIPFLDFWARIYFQDLFMDNFQVMNGGLYRKANFKIMPIVFGLTFLIIGGLISEGTKLKEEQDLTI